MISSQKGDAKELRRARRRRLEVEVRVKINGNVENVSKLRIMMHAIAQTMLLADIFYTWNVVGCLTTQSLLPLLFFNSEEHMFD
jgi:hypothetical protein